MGGPLATPKDAGRSVPAQPSWPRPTAETLGVVLSQENPLSSECGTDKTAKARFWPWLSEESVPARLSWPRPNAAPPAFRAQGSGLRVRGPGFRVQGSGFRVQGEGFRIQGSGLWGQGPGFRM